MGREPTDREDRSGARHFGQIDVNARDTLRSHADRDEVARGAAELFMHMGKHGALVSAANV